MPRSPQGHPVLIQAGQSGRAPVTGNKGDPRPATAEKGKKMLDIMTAALAEVMHDGTLWRTPDPVWTPGRGQGTTAGARTNSDTDLSVAREGDDACCRTPYRSRRPASGVRFCPLASHASQPPRYHDTSV